ncbi:putative cysteine desulfurase IscS 1 [Caldalkalibacillus thermarum]|uniref:cysteine desulfurase family protein n=1 Tax=Caldalkalibacillus thermarum TaxID=296745 RepID=UPI001668DF8F|nr:cysteine desulfurase family protein [Caldalkalibacillus thermarum]GGK16328.1 putative cysteine desulfurase IscS 1 [Caldalkalibacillus thermarum]
MRRIYVDHAATTPVHPRVIEAMLPYMDKQFGNPSSIHVFGRETKAAVEEARRTIARLLGAEAKQITFTSGGTEADNMAILGVAFAAREKGNHVITSQIEHHAVLHACQYLESQGFAVTYLPVDENGRVRPDDVREALREDTILVSVMYANNETGAVQPVEEIGALVREKGILFHTDAVQALGMLSFDVSTLPVDLVSFSGHKINGPKGSGCLYVRETVKLHPLLYGGAQERNRRAGTENVPGIIGFAEALKLAQQDIEAKREKYAGLRQRFLDILRAEQVVFQINGDLDHCLPHIVNLSFAGVKADALLMNLDLEGIAASSGSACTAGSLQPSHVILAMYGDEERAGSAIRFSFGLGNTLEQIEEVAYKTARIIKRLQA